MSLVHRPFGYRLTAIGQPLEAAQLDPKQPGADEVLVEIAGCGVCHTDIGFAVDGVPTRHPLPLVLGHEIAGRVVDAGAKVEEWRGQSVIVPAVIPCGVCPACLAGRPTICRDQFMPGNDGDGGFATHVLVPARGLCPVPDELPAGIELADLSVVADAVTTPYEAIHRAELCSDDVAVFVGVGGVGGFGAQIAAARGAAVVAIDVDAQRLALIAEHGAQLTLNAKDSDFRSMKKELRGFVKESGRSGIGLKIFETSGTPAGQQTAFGLLDHGARLAVVGYSPSKVELRLSNLMAFDATAQGNWGCAPEHYPAVLDLVLSGQVSLGPFIESRPLQETPEVMAAVAEHRMPRRPVLVPQA